MKKILATMFVMLVLTSGYSYAQCTTNPCGKVLLDGEMRASGVTWDSPNDYSNIFVRFEYNHFNSPSSAPSSAYSVLGYFSSAYSEWNSAGSRLTFGQDSSPVTTSSCDNSDSDNTICWSADPSGPEAYVDANYKFQYSSSDYESASHYEKINNTDIILRKNAGYTFGLGSNRYSGYVDFEDTIVHELGHVAGLEHATVDGPAMEGGSFSNRNNPIGSITNADKAGIFFTHTPRDIYSFPGYDIVLSARPISDPVYLVQDDTHGSLLDMNRASKLVLASGSSETVLTLGNGANMIIRNGAVVEDGKIVVNSGAILEIEADGIIKDTDIDINDGGRVIIDGGNIDDFKLNIAQGGLFSMSAGSVNNMDVLVLDGGELQITGGIIELKDFDVNPGGSAKLSGSSTVIKFMQYANIYSRGIIEIDGPSFESANPSDSWSYVMLNGSGADDSFIKNASFEDSYWGVYCSSADNILIDGLVVDGSAHSGGKIVNCDNFQVHNSQFKNAVYDGIFVDNGSSIEVRSSIFSGNGLSGGLVFRGYSVGVVGLDYAECSYNSGLFGSDGSTFTNNKYGINAYSNSTVTVGVQGCDLTECGGSQIYGNNTADARATNGSHIYAPYTWWGQDPPSASQFIEVDSQSRYGQVHRNDHLACASGSCPSPVITELPRVESTLSVTGSESQIDVTESTSYLYHAYRLSDLAVLVNRGSAPSKRTTIFERIAAGPRADHRRFAEMAYLRNEVRVDPSAALARANRLLDVGTSSKSEESQGGIEVLEGVDRELILRLLFDAALRTKNQTVAAQTAGELVALGDVDATQGLLGLLYEEIFEQPLPPVQAEVPDRKGDLVARGDVTLGSYPTPFTQAVTLVVELADASRSARLAVYDALGREVSVVHTGTLSEGRHVFEVDASALPSGMYLARLRTETAETTHQLVRVR